MGGKTAAEFEEDGGWRRRRRRRMEADEGGGMTGRNEREGRIILTVKNDCIYYVALSLSLSKNGVDNREKRRIK